MTLPSPIAVCSGSSRPVLCAVTRALRILDAADEQWRVTQGTALDYPIGNRIAKAGAVVAVAVLGVVLISRWS